MREEANGAKVVVDLSCGHTRGRYYALVNNERREDGISSCMPMSAERLPSEPCARYNKREFEAFAARKLAEFRAAGRGRRVRRRSCAANTRPSGERTSARAACARIARRT